MTRTPSWEKVPMAAGSDQPAWPLPTVTPKFATWSFGGGRPAGCAVGACERWHAGVDLTGAPHGALVIAPEDGILAGLDKGWTEGTRAIFLQTDSGLFLVLGGVIAGSHKEFSLTTAQRVRKGDKLGRIVGGYGMLHFETYKAEPTRKSNSRWYRDDPPPPGLLNPTSYVERMVGDTVLLLQTRPRLEALRDLGYYKGDVAAAWSEAATDALKSAQAALAIGVDGRWGPETEDAIHKALAARQPATPHNDETTAEGDPTPRTGRDALSPIRIVGTVVASLAVTGLAAAIVISRRRPALEEPRDGV
jgi:Putative peptidoglycan binding domain